jgi:hypothetical protein
MISNIKTGEESQERSRRDFIYPFAYIELEAGTRSPGTARFIEMPAPLAAIDVDLFNSPWRVC